MISDKDRQVNIILDSLSGIDGDLLMDVEAARPVVRLVEGKNRPAVRWQRWTAVAASLAFLFVTGALIAHFMGLGAGSQTKYQAPEEGMKDHFEISRTEAADSASRGGRDLAGQAALQVLSEAGEADGLFSPAGLYQSLALLDYLSGREEAFVTAWYPDLAAVESASSLTVTNSLITADGAYGSQDSDSLLQGAARRFRYQLVPSSGETGILQEIRIDLDPGAALEGGLMAGGIQAFLIPEATVYSRAQDKTLLMEVTVSAGRLLLALPDPSVNPQSLLDQGDLDALFKEDWKPGQKTALRLPAFRVTSDHQWMTSGLDAFCQVEENGLSLAYIRQKIELVFRPSLSADSASWSRVTDLDRPFLFSLLDEQGLPLAAGLIRSPFQ